MSNVSRIIGMCLTFALFLSCTWLLVVVAVVSPAMNVALGWTVALVAVLLVGAVLSFYETVKLAR